MTSVSNRSGTPIKPYKVHSGDTLSGIAAKNGTTVDALVKANHIPNPDKIFTGQLIRFADQFDSAKGGGRSTGQGSSTARPALRGDAFEPSKTGKPDTQQVKGTSTSATHVKVPYYGQHDPGHGYQPSDTACYSAATAMAAASGAKVLGLASRIELGKSEDRSGRLAVDKKKATEGRDYIDQQLGKGKPVVVGVSYKDANYNVDGLTDHFVTVTGRGVDDKGRTYYTFNDPWPGAAKGGKDTNPSNRLYVDSHTGGLTRPAGSWDVAMVCRNA